jgi:hypothetical protein
MSRRGSTRLIPNCAREPVACLVLPSLWLGADESLLDAICGDDSPLISASVFRPITRGEGGAYLWRKCESSEIQQTLK